MTVPRNLLDEIDRELLRTSDALVREADRLAGLIELNRHALAVSIDLGRPLVVTELTDGASGVDTARIARLLRVLRSDLADDCPDEPRAIP
jgi:hypothetical protein